jgi:hypothetical protein
MVVAEPLAVEMRTLDMNTSLKSAPPFIWRNESHLDSDRACDQNAV